MFLSASDLGYLQIKFCESSTHYRGRTVKKHISLWYHPRMLPIMTMRMISLFQHMISLNSWQSVHCRFILTTLLPCNVDTCLFTLSIPDKSWWCRQETRGFWSERRWSPQTLLCWMKGWSFRKDQHTHLYLIHTFIYKLAV